MNDVMLKLALAAIDFAMSDQEVAHAILSKGDKETRNLKLRSKYARRRLASAQQQLTAACALLREEN
jgi:hypothetical protein